MAIICSITATDPGANPGGYIEASSTAFDIAGISLLCILKRVSLWGIKRKRGLVFLGERNKK